MLEWLIVGGGVHGTHLSHVLTGRGGVARDRIRVLDPHGEPLARWDECAANTGMAFLRSPFVHHLGLDPFGLRTFARSREGRAHRRFAWPYHRPSLDLFRAHARKEIAEHGLAELRIVGQATSLGACLGGMRVETSGGSLTARRVLLALGAGDQPAWPPWARALRAQGARVDHVFDPGFARARMPRWSRAVVLGGGITAAQTALALGERAPGTVTLLARHAPRLHQFDADPGWMGPRELDAYARVTDPGERRRLLGRARHRGSMPDDVASGLRRAIQTGAVARRIAGVAGAAIEGGDFRLDLDDGQVLVADHLVLATGFEPARPGGAWLDRAIADLGLACAGCGYPIVDRSLRWHPGIHVSGPLAELEIGPPARNILGARMAAERLLGAA